MEMIFAVRDSRLKFLVFVDESEKLEIDVCSAAVDFELLKASIEEVEQFAKDYIDCEEKEYKRIIDSIL
ncbi:hypothetical protein DWX11_05980 [Ruminococcus sp. AF18-29]|nr:hypothetical protein DWX11_05980 [Ruminococcus sp. AF18-29]